MRPWTHGQKNLSDLGHVEAHKEKKPRHEKNREGRGTPKQSHIDHGKDEPEETTHHDGGQRKELIERKILDYTAVTPAAYLLDEYEEYADIHE